MFTKLLTVQRVVARGIALALWRMQEVVYIDLLAEEAQACSSWQRRCCSRRQGRPLVFNISSRIKRREEVFQIKNFNFDSYIKIYFNLLIVWFIKAYFEAYFKISSNNFFFYEFRLTLMVWENSSCLFLESTRNEILDIYIYILESNK